MKPRSETATTHASDSIEITTISTISKPRTQNGFTVLFKEWDELRGMIEKVNTDVSWWDRAFNIAFGVSITAAFAWATSPAGTTKSNLLLFAVASGATAIVSLLAVRSLKAQSVVGIQIILGKMDSIVEQYTEVEEPDQLSEAPKMARETGYGDEMFDEAAEAVFSAGKASASMLQRRLRIGYARAARLLDLLEKNDVIGPPDGARPRDVLIGSLDEIGDPKT